jgi:hypothetical protein
VNRGPRPKNFINDEIGGNLEIDPDLMANLLAYRPNRNNVGIVNSATGIADQLVDGKH